MTTRLKTRPGNPTDHFETTENIAAHLDAAQGDGDPALVAAALGDIDRIKGMTQGAHYTDLTHESSCRAMPSDGQT